MVKHEFQLDIAAGDGIANDHQIGLRLKMKTRYPQLAAGLAADGELVSPSARPRRAASRPAVRHTAAKPAPANEPTASSTTPAGDPATFDELLAELRETWPA